MKVIDLINKLNIIGYDENTELTFDFSDENGECYEIPIKKFWYGEELTGESYHNDRINIELNVKDCEEYTKVKEDIVADKIIDALSETLNNFGSYQHF